MKPLPNDVCRCQDAGCRERNGCRRWLERESGLEQSSLFPYDIPIGSKCPIRIPVDKPKRSKRDIVGAAGVASIILLMIYLL